MRECVREREIVCVCERESECVRVCERERLVPRVLLQIEHEPDLREWGRESVCERVRKSVRESVCERV